MRTRLATMTEIWANLNSITRRKVIKLQESLRCKRESESLKPWTSIFWTLISARLSVPFTCSLLFAMWWEMQPRQLGCWILSPRLTDALPANRAANRNEITTTSIYTFHVLSSLDAESFLSLRPPQRHQAVRRGTASTGKHVWVCSELARSPSRLPLPLPTLRLPS